MHFVPSLYHDASPSSSVVRNKSRPEGTEASGASKILVDQATTCIFCGVSVQNGFDIVWEDEHFIAFRDHNPSAAQHVQLVPKQHIDSVKSLTRADVGMLMQMGEIGKRILDTLDVPPRFRKLGFHIPPFNSVSHLHLHVQGLPYRSALRSVKYLVISGRNGRVKGLSWFISVDQSIDILEKGGRIGVLPYR